MKKVLIFPGAFNPPHLGHVSAIQKTLQSYPFDEVWIIPSGRREDKKIVTSYEHRRALNELFIEYLNTAITTPVKLITDELDDTEGKYTSEILYQIKSQPDINFTQLIGTDGIIYLRQYLLDEQFTQEKFIVIKRSGHTIPKDMTFSDNVVFIDETSSEISSTAIRTMANAGDTDYERLLPLEIATYIKEYNLYK
ncbi:MAG: nicotinate-nicotinamide nucleotide adenylyltransferase [Candidatus Pacebacteria bacterium]|jgi:nicotinate-nucleotide adenylyltransferase|nr:nicotinate-nicotinamide nucleotide adenylyltransferase [Candidatus Paceibacterota bacterium]